MLKTLQYGNLEAYQPKSRGGRKQSYVQVEGVEKEDDVFALVVRQTDVLEVTIDDRGATELRGGLR